MDEDTGYLKETCIAWELLWLLFNAILLVEGLVFLKILRTVAIAADHGYCRSLFGYKFPFAIAAVAIPPNVVYVFGPLIDAYIFIFLGKRMGRWRYAFFTAGLFFWMAVLLRYAEWGRSHVG
jgi:hypothetical protein